GRGVSEGLDEVLRVVAVEIAPLQRRHGAAAIDVAAGFRDRTRWQTGVCISVDGQRQVGGVAGAAGEPGATGAFHAAPAVVAAAGKSGRLKVDLFHGVLAD